MEIREPEKSPTSRSRTFKSPEGLNLKIAQLETLDIKKMPTGQKKKKKKKKKKTLIKEDKDDSPERA
mgnify:CR=1 FL=1